MLRRKNICSITTKRDEVDLNFNGVKKSIFVEKKKY